MASRERQWKDFYLHRFARGHCADGQKCVHILNTSLKTWFTAMGGDVWGHIAWGTGTSNLPARLPVGSRRSTLGHWASLRENVC